MNTAITGHAHEEDEHEGEHHDEDEHDHGEDDHDEEEGETGKRENDRDGAREGSGSRPRQPGHRRRQ